MKSKKMLTGNKIFHLATCKTCQRVLKEIRPSAEFSLQDVKSDPITVSQLEKLKQKAGSFEALFSRRSRKFHLWGLHKKNLTEDDMRDLILQDYTFLKRPIIVVGDHIFIGSRKATMVAAKKLLK